MSTFNGITFTPLRDSDGWRPNWRREPIWNEEHYPETDTDEVQFGGLKNPTLSVEVLIDEDDDAAALEALVDGLPYTLADYPTGTTYTAVRLRDCDLRRRPWAEEWRGTLTFEREAT